MKDVSLYIKCLEITYLCNVLSMQSPIYAMLIYAMTYLCNDLSMQSPIYAMSYLCNVLSMQCTFYAMYFQ